MGWSENAAVQRIVDTQWRIEKFEDVEVFTGHRKQLRTLLKRSTAEFEGLRNERLKSGTDHFDSETCPSYPWYNELAEFANRLAPARRELGRKTVQKAGGGTLRLVEPLTPGAIETLAEAYRGNLLTAIENTLFTQRSLSHADDNGNR